MQPVPLSRRLAAEAFGTFCLVFAGTGAVVIDAVAGGPLGHGGVAAAFGLGVAVMIFALGHISGAHLNPAVTAAFALGRHFPAREVAPYVAVQVAGALLASLALRGLFGLRGGLGAAHPAHVGQGGALVLEAGLTLVHLWLYLAGPTLGALAGAALYAFLRGGAGGGELPDAASEATSPAACAAA